MKKSIAVALSLFMLCVVMAGCEQIAQRAMEYAASEGALESTSQSVSLPTTTSPPIATPQVQPVEGIKIAYFVSTMSNDFNQARANAAVQYGEALGIEVTVFDGEADVNLMTQYVDMLATSDFDGASLHVWEAEAATPGVEAAIEAGIAVTSYFSPLGDTGIPTYRADEESGSFRMGADAAQMWLAANPGKPIVTVQLGWPYHAEVISGRTDPFVEGIASVVGEDGFTNLGCLDCSGGIESTMEVMENILVTHPEVNIIFSEAGDLTPGALLALESAGRGTMDDGVPTTEIVCSFDCPVTELAEIFDPGCSLKASTALPPIGTSEAIIDLIIEVYRGNIASVSYPAQEVFGPVQVVDYWSMTLEDALDWYNGQYGTTLTASDLF